MFTAWRLLVRVQYRPPAGPLLRSSRLLKGVHLSLARARPKPLDVPEPLRTRNGIAAKNSTDESRQSVVVLSECTRSIRAARSIAPLHSMRGRLEKWVNESLEENASTYPPVESSPALERLRSWDQGMGASEQTL
jgi:hypothetical protein